MITGTHVVGAFFMQKGGKSLIDFNNKTYQNLLQTMLGQVPNSYDKREGSIIQTAIGPAAYALEEFYMALDQVQRAAYIQTAVGDSLDLLAVVAGLTRYPASAAVRLGKFSQPIPLGSRFSTINGSDSINFVVSQATDNPNEFQLKAETSGVIGNDYIGNILPITYLSGLEMAMIDDILIPGEDTESDDSLRERIIVALNEKPFGGNVAAYRQFIGGLDGVGGVQVYPTWNGGGTVKCSIIGTDFEPASALLIESVQNAVDPPVNQGLGLGMAPIGAQVTISTPEVVNINVSATLTLAVGYDVGQVQKPIEEVIAGYLLQVRERWSDPTVSGGVQYQADVYLAQIIAAMMQVTGVINAKNVQLNGQPQDVSLTQTGVLQQIPKEGTVTLNVEP